jgi:hypothetical protein
MRRIMARLTNAAAFRSVTLVIAGEPTTKLIHAGDEAEQVAAGARFAFPTRQ